VDTGSSNTWVGAGKKYVRTSTSVQTSDRVVCLALYRFGSPPDKFLQSVTYGSGEFSGNEFTDTVSLGSGLTITKQSIGVATSSQGFQGVDGILGSVISLSQ
jgi:cathepsin E